jgi:hypothetical protein
MYSWIFTYFYDIINITDNWIFNIFSPIIIYAILHEITYNSVGNLYKSDLINGVISGKIAYFCIMFINILITAVILYLIKVIIWIHNLLKIFALLNWIEVMIIVLLIIVLIVGIKIIRNIK